MSRVATIILNRNLPEVTNKLYEHLQKYDQNLTDVFVLEAGSDPDKLSKYCTWYVKEKNTIKHGLRYNRGMNYALLNLYNEKKWNKYDAFFLITNDTELSLKKTIDPLISIMDKHKNLGILSPISKNWGEKFLLKREKTKYFWFIHNNAYFMRRKFIETIMETNNPNFMNFVFDGTNFRGYLSESELIGKAYLNDWAAAITSKVYAEHNETYLLNKSDLIRTEGFNENLKLYLEEGRQWIKRKYGFSSHWSMHRYTKSLYDQFFEQHPELNKYKL
ncbi:hypothetical protein OAM36_03065 [Candidatus Pelagibacter sp.]|nr:hypothetical protein [Candidatus Pelagibacter sp.]